MIARRHTIPGSRVAEIIQKLETKGFLESKKQDHPEDDTFLINNQDFKDGLLTSGQNGGGDGGSGDVVSLKKENLNSISDSKPPFIESEQIFITSLASDLRLYIEEPYIDKKLEYDEKNFSRGFKDDNERDLGSEAENLSVNNELEGNGNGNGNENGNENENEIEIEWIDVSTSADITTNDIDEEWYEIDEVS
ncbi:hypothetical protein G9A89_010037 [Geosiphon pyriformis]|nr:hypothetical protein G9A89_010037 [Geosiphon pyriformis]